MLVEDAQGIIFSTTDNKCFSMTAPRHSACIMHCARNCKANQSKNMKANLNYSWIQIYAIVLDQSCFGKWCHIYKYFRISYRNDDLSSKWHFARYVAEDHDQELSITHVLQMHIWAKATYNCSLVVWNQLVVLPIPVVLTSLAVGQSHDFPNARDTTIKMFRYS